MHGIIFDIKRYAIHDGPGIRTAVFFKGCPLTCPWCHNPEGMGREPRIVYRKSMCIGCLECIDACPEKALSKGPEMIQTDETRCQHCGACVDICPAGVRERVQRLLRGPGRMPPAGDHRADNAKRNSAAEKHDGWIPF